MPDTPPVSFKPDDVARVVMLTYGQMQNGQPFWCYVAVKPSQQDRMKELIASKTFDLRNFEPDGLGEIIVSGEGVAPPRDVTKQVATTFKIPLNEMFLDLDPNAAITKEIERLEREAGNK